MAWVDVKQTKKPNSFIGGGANSSLKSLYCSFASTQFALLPSQVSSNVAMRRKRHLLRANFLCTCVQTCTLHTQIKPMIIALPEERGGKGDFDQAEGAWRRPNMIESVFFSTFYISLTLLPLRAFLFYFLFPHLSSVCHLLSSLNFVKKSKVRQWGEESDETGSIAYLWCYESRLHDTM